MNGRIRYSKEQLSEFISKFVKDKGRVPKAKDFLHNREYPSFKQYQDEWGGWGKALIELGYRETTYPRNKNLRAIQEYNGHYDY